MFKNARKKIIRIIKTAFIAGIVLLVLAIFSPTTRAGEINSLFVHINHTNDPTVGGLDREQYSYMQNIPGVQYVYVNIADMNDRGAALNAINAALAQYPDAASAVMTFTGHGVTDGLGTDSAFSKVDEVWLATRALTDNQLVGTTILDCCGSGTLFAQFNAAQLLEDGMFNGGILASSAAYQLGYAPDMGGRIIFGVDKGGADQNNDGVITSKELVDFLKKNNNYDNKDDLIMNPDTPMFFRDKQAKDEWVKKNRGFCGVVTPGQSSGYDTSGKPSMLGQKNVYPRDGKSDAKHKKRESEVNYKLRDGKMNYLRARDVKESTEDETYGEKTDDGVSNYDQMIATTKLGNEEIAKITWLNDTGSKDGMISEAQALEALTDPKHAYTVKGKKMQPFIYLKRSVVNAADGNPVIVAADCEFKTPDPNRGKSGNNNGGGNNGGGNNNGGGGNNGGGQQGGGQPQNGQQQRQPTPYPTPYPAGYTCPPVYAPVCDINSQTQFSRCVAETQKQVKVAHDGACTSEETSKTEQKNSVAKLVDLIQQLFQSGLPQNLIESVIRAIVPLIANFFTSQTNTVVLN